MNKLQEDILVVLENVDTICKENKIEYALYGGTFLGAVRHKGYIPWDDDVDIIMLRSEYDKLHEVLLDKSNYPDGYYFQSNLITSKYYNPTPKIRDTNSTMKEIFPSTQEDSIGPWVDLFIWDNVPDDINERRKYFNKLQRIDKIVFLTTYIQKVPSRSGFGNNIRGIIQKINEKFHKYYFFMPYILKKRDRLVHKYASTNTNKVGVPTYCFFTGFDEFEASVLNKEDISELSDYTFENLTLPGYKNYDKVLSSFYGDYMKIPEEHERVVHNIK